MGQVIPVLIAGTIVLASISAVLYAIRTDAIDGSPVDDPARQAEADALLDILLDSSGQGWESGVQNVSRLGLANGTGGIDLEKMSAMKDSSYGTQYGTGGMDYDLARAGLGLDTTRDFHIRVYPVGIDDAFDQAALAEIQTAYIGDWDELVAVEVDLDTEAAMSVAAQAELNASMGSGTAAERALLKTLGVDIDDRVYITTDYPDVLVDLAIGPSVPLPTLVSLELLDGDVYPDDSEYLQNVLPDRLADYDVLIIGGNVQHSQLASDAVKGAIHDWVLDGGTIMVMGTEDVNSAFLMPLYADRTETVTGAALANDPSHPLLSTPEQLDWDGYTADGDGWTYVAGAHDATDAFDHVVQDGGEDLLSVSAEGAFGDGRIFLSSYTPDGLATAAGEGEGLAFLKNLFLFADRERLILDYGADVPDDVQVASAVRYAHLWDDDIGHVAVRVEVLLW